MYSCSEGTKELVDWLAGEWERGKFWILVCAGNVPFNCVMQNTRGNFPRYQLHFNSFENSTLLLRDSLWKEKDTKWSGQNRGRRRGTRQGEKRREECTILVSSATKHRPRRKLGEEGLASPHSDTFLWLVGPRDLVTVLPFPEVFYQTIKGVAGPGPSLCCHSSEPNVEGSRAQCWRKLLVLRLPSLTAHKYKFILAKEKKSTNALG